MEKEILNGMFDFIEEMDKKNADMVANIYDIIGDSLENIKTTALLGKSISIMPYGDFLTNTFYSNSLVEFFVIFHTERETIDFTVTTQKVNKKGQKKNSLYQKIIGAPTIQGEIQAENICDCIYNNLKEVIAPSQSIYHKYNIIMLKINEQIKAKITVCYDANFNQNKLLVRRYNTWTYIDAIKYLDELDKKNVETKYNYSKFVKLFKALELELLIANETSLYIGKNHLVENILYNVPSNLFLEKDKKVALETILAFLKNANYKKFKTADDSSVYMFDENSYFEKSHYKQFINKIYYANENILKILEEQGNDA